MSILLDVILGQQEKLPNILSGGFQFYNYGHYSIAASSGGGAIQTRREGTDPCSWVGSGETARTTANAFYLDASKTSGTGFGVYQNDKNVQPNNIALIYWKRLQ